jgi:acyl dehydratase
MPTLASLEKGHEFAAAEFELSPDWVSAYTLAVEDDAIPCVDPDAVPPMAIAALSIRALLDQAALPPGTVHVGQEIVFSRSTRAGERLVASARIHSRGERQGWVLMVVDMSVAGAGGDLVMNGRATLTFPVDGEAEA